MPILPTIFRGKMRVAALACAVIAAVLSIIIAWRVRIESDRYDRVELGMTVAEVDEILGPTDEAITMSFNTSARWSSIGGTVYVCFDQNNKATWKLLTAYGITKHPPQAMN